MVAVLGRRDRREGCGKQEKTWCEENRSFVGVLLFINSLSSDYPPSLASAPCSLEVHSELPQHGQVRVLPLKGWSVSGSLPCPLTLL